MEQLFNHTTIYNLISSNHTSQAIAFFLEQFDTFVRKQSLAQNKLFLSSLNFGLYNYILLETGSSLHECCNKNRILIEDAYDIYSIKDIGITILKNYSNLDTHLTQRYNNEEIEKAIQYIHEHLDQKILLDELCYEIGLNKCYFCTLFKKETNYTLSAYINNARIQLSKTLLKDDTLSLEIISSKCGFQSYAYFCTTFKKITGLSPKQFKEDKQE